MIDIEELWSVKTLRRTDGAIWQDVLSRIVRDTTSIEPDLPRVLEVGRLVSILLDDMARYPMPEWQVPDSRTTLF